MTPRLDGTAGLETASDSRSWLERNAGRLAASGLVDLVARRSRNLLLASRLRADAERLGAAPYLDDAREREARDTLSILLRAWTDARDAAA